MQKPHTSIRALDRVVAAISAYPGTLKDFSDKSGIPYPSLREYASGEKKPGLDALAAIVATADVSPAWLLSGEGEMYQHRSTTKELRVDAKLLTLITSELELAWIRVREQKVAAITAVLEALPLNEQQYFKLIADGTLISRTELAGRIDHIKYMTVLACTTYNLIASIEEDSKRSRRAREEAYQLVSLGLQSITAKRRRGAAKKRGKSKGLKQR
jgi:hypothetical protein